MDIESKLNALRLEVAEAINILAMCGDKTPVNQLGEKLCKALNASAAPVPAMPIPKQEPAVKILSGIKDQQQNAWLAVCKVLDEVKPDWLTHGKKGVDCAVYAIRSLSEPAQAVAIPDEPTGDMISAGIEAMNRGLGLFGDNHAQIVNNIWEDMYAEALYASPKQE